MATHYHVSTKTCHKKKTWLIGRPEFYCQLNFAKLNGRVKYVFQQELIQNYQLVVLTPVPIEWMSVNILSVINLAMQIKHSG